jgi:MFS family permease
MGHGREAEIVAHRLLNVEADYGLSDALGQLTFSVRAFPFASSTLAYGALGGRYGRRLVLLAGLALFLLGVFMQNFMGAGVAQIYGAMADGTPVPLAQITVVMATLGLLSAVLARRGDRDARRRQRAPADARPQPCVLPRHQQPLERTP